MGCNNAFARTLVTLGMTLGVCALSLSTLQGCRTHKPQTVDCSVDPDGTVCTPESPADRATQARFICLSGTCVASKCGDAFIDLGANEQCEDTNGTEHDGCEPDTCTFSCVDDAGCDDGNLCNGAETCNAGLHRCNAGMIAAAGTTCKVSDTINGKCNMGMCSPAACDHDGTKETGEECDDGNTASGDGCENDCTFSCDSAYRDSACPAISCDFAKDTQVVSTCTAGQGQGTVGNLPVNTPIKTCVESRTVCNQTVYNGCTRAGCVAGVGCSYIPRYRSSSIKTATDTDHINNRTGVYSDKLTAWTKQFKRECDSTCSKSQPLVPILDSGTALNAKPYCQLVGSIEKPTCYDSFDYDCSGAFEWPAPMCNVFNGIKINGWLAKYESECGEEQDFIEYDSAALTCKSTTYASAVNCR